MLRYTTGIANLTEFYTCTLWDTEMEMFAFMSSGAHRDMMWNFSKWSDAFWAMRWEATQDELGHWEIAGADEEGSYASRTNLALGATIQSPSRENYVSRWLVEQGVIPKPDIPETPPGTPGTTAVLARIPIILPTSLVRLRRVLRPWRSDRPHLLRFTLAVGPGECFLIAAWEAGALEESRALMATLMRGFPNAWTMRFRGHDFEVGHWDDMRLREILQPEDPLGSARKC